MTAVDEKKAKEARLKLDEASRLEELREINSLRGQVLESRMLINAFDMRLKDMENRDYETRRIVNDVKAQVNNFYEMYQGLEDTESFSLLEQVRNDVNHLGSIVGTFQTRLDCERIDPTRARKKQNTTPP